MDTIILAAGENVRLQVAGLAPGRKPLIIKNGEVLIRRLARQAHELHRSPWTRQRIIIVTSPSNTEDIVFATREYATHYIVQPIPRGPQQAIDLALNFVGTEHVLLLMGDNYIDELPKMRFTGVSIVQCDDENLHPLQTGRFVDARAEREIDGRWLGPLVFRPQDWRYGQDSWVKAFAHAPQFNYYVCKAEDMGTL